MPVCTLGERLPDIHPDARTYRDQLRLIEPGQPQGAR
jgi:hypothetical protein